MKEEIQKALMNIRIVVNNARMTFEEHQQLQNDLMLIKNNLLATTPEVNKPETGVKGKE